MSPTLDLVLKAQRLKWVGKVLRRDEELSSQEDPNEGTETL